MGNNHLSLQDIAILMSKMAEAKVFEIIFTGGEPLLNKQSLFYGIKLAREFGIGVSLNSNLIPLTKKDAYFLREWRVRSVLTSILGPNDGIHDAITSRPGSFKETIRGIKYLQEVDIYPAVNIVVSQKNRSYLNETMKFLTSLGIKHICATRAGWPGNCSDFSSLSLSFDDFRDYLEDFYCMSQELKIPVAVLESYPYCGMKELSRYRKFLGRRCNAGITTLTIGTNGLARPCSHLDIEYGNLLVENLKTVWSGMDDWRNGKMLPSECKICPLLKECGGGCRMETKMHSGSLSAMDPYSSLNDIEYALRQMENIRSSTKTRLGTPSTFLLPEGLRIREEFFGSVVFVKNHFKGYLNREATKFLLKLEPKKLYSSREIFNWNNYDKDNLTQFVSKLFNKGLIISAKKGGKRDESSVFRLRDNL